jgi:hypothetical protein
MDQRKTNSVIGIGRYLIQKVVRPRKMDILRGKEKHRAIFAILEDDLVSNKMLIDANTVKSEAFFRFIIVARADVFPTPANIQKRYHQPRTNCQRCNKDLQPTFTGILNSCAANPTEMTKRHNKVVGIVRLGIEDPNDFI